ncbi:MAG: hypothetical protein HOP12_11360, partial [Candidatus Eisenbacteria bacterium]|nr:hypothetical protein [Candidatus Eisenbacteria bacterium]
ELPEYDALDRMRHEIRSCGLWFSAHPLDGIEGVGADAGDAGRRARGPTVTRHPGRRVTVVGLPCAMRRVETKQGGLMLFLTLADRSGLVECVLFPDAYRRFAAAARGEVVRATGRVDEALGACTLTVEALEALAVAGPANELAGERSRNASVA